MPTSSSRIDILENPQGVKHNAPLRSRLNSRGGFSETGPGMSRFLSKVALPIRKGPFRRNRPYFHSAREGNREVMGDERDNECW